MTEQQLSQYEAVNGLAEPAEVWRNEVHDRLAHYKRRRGRRIEGAYSMRFPFPVDEVTSAALPAPSVSPVEEPFEVEAETVPQPAATADVLLSAEPAVSPADESALEAALPALEAQAENNDLVLQPPPAAEDEDAIFIDPTPRSRPKRKVIAFPRQATVAPEVAYRLADPVTPEVPRILDVPEELEAIPATPFLDGLQLDLPEAQAAAAVAREHVELPFHAAKLSRRILAGAVDLAITGVAAGVFAAVAYQLLDHPPLAKPFVLGLLAGTVVLWTAYQYLFVVHAGKTLGMMAAGVRFATFKGKAPNLRQRRNRVLGLFLSSLSLGMGLMWALVDIDGLCWHDRLSRTFLTPKT